MVEIALCQEEMGVKGGSPKLVFGHIRHHFAVHGINPLAGDIPLKPGIGIEDRKPVCSRTIKRPHDLRHRRGLRKRSLRFYHQLTGSEMMIELRPEHHIPDLHDLHLTEEYP